jgi:hypothetical protein
MTHVLYHFDIFWSILDTFFYSILTWGESLVAHPHVGLWTQSLMVNLDQFPWQCLVILGSAWHVCCSFCCLNYLTSMSSPTLAHPRLHHRAATLAHLCMLQCTVEQVTLKPPSYGGTDVKSQNLRHGDASTGRKGANDCEWENYCETSSQ